MPFIPGPGVMVDSWWSIHVRLGAAGGKTIENGFSWHRNNRRKPLQYDVTLLARSDDYVHADG